MKFDIKFHVAALFAAMIALGAQAAPVSPAQVCRAVSAWAAANGSAFASPGSALSAVPEYDADGATSLYYKVRMSNGGLVIASPDTDIDLVVAVLEDSNGDFPAGHPLPSILKKDMRNRLSIVRRAASSSGSSSGGSGVLMASMASASTLSASSAELPEDVKASVVKANAQWEKYGSTGGVQLQSASTYGDDEVAPYVRRIVDGFESGGRFTHWNQAASPGGALCYNYHTPNNEVCGCVATAGAAIMQFFGNATDVGEVGPVNEDAPCTLYGGLYDCKTIGGGIDWSVMANLPDEASRELAGRITYNLGVLVGMSWASGGPGSESGAYISNLADALKAYKFSDARHVTFNILDGGTSQYFKMVYAQNWAGAPVVLGIIGDVGGHAVVACGYAKTPDNEELCRVFMGWGGLGDAWYKFPQVGSFAIVDEAVTMIGYDSTADADPADLASLDEEKANDILNRQGTVPICGRTYVTNTELKFPGVTKSVGEGDEAVSFTLTTSVDSNGFFAVRIPVDTKDVSVVHEESGMTFVISPFNSKVLEDEGKDRAALESAMPGELLFLVLNTVVKSTVELAREKALRSGKAVLMVSGSGSVRENMLIDYLTYLDSTTDMSNRFVLVRLNSGDYSSPYGDGDPSIGVFDPNVGSAELRWWSENGRLAYENFIDYDADNQGDINYTFTVDSAEALTNSVMMVLDSGYDKYLRHSSGISVEVKAVDALGNVLEGIAGVDMPYGVHEKCWTNNEVAVFSAPDVCTNEALGVKYRCVGWCTNEVASEEYAVNTNMVELALSTNVAEVSFAWVWKVQAYRVSSSVAKSAGAEAFDADGAVSPAEKWVYPGDRVTVVAKNALYGGEWGLSGWMLTSGISGADYDYANPNENGSAISFTVNEPVNVSAKYRYGVAAAANPVEYSVSISVNPPELADVINAQNVEGNESSLSLGENTTKDGLAAFDALASEVVDSTGGVWRCTGWVLNGTTNSVQDYLAVLDPAAPRDIELVWELQPPLEEEEVLPEPGEISIKGISQVDGKWVITVSNGVKGCWYWLYSSDDLSGLAGVSGQWSAGLANVDGPNPQQATEDGDVVFKATASEGKMFWRAKATATESGDK